ncbi:asparagine synthase (glutamine-hydrolyzing) [Amycolatopsis minnesotensis]|uniref:asparagine synthase (glutamine-hydrolyzing) n=1 Tax=Amycolatopsis minnesotensis TaxID=337894 RepID=A0ABP5D064_9PSEU
MCGIAGKVSYERDLRRELATARAMVDTMSCRGPDAEGLWARQRVVLGHRRLAVIDPAGGAQPMTVQEDGRVVAAISFCGEIYNFRELRASLVASGHRFRTRSDTEVALRAYVEWGAAAVERFDGMFALAVWDERTSELLLARDRMGVKPLFYARTGDGVVFGSEPKAVLADPVVQARVDADGLAEVLDMVKTPERSVFRGISEVRPGHLVTVRETGLVKRPYWTLRALPHTDDLPTTVDTVRGVLEEVVTGQLVSDVPVCTLLSGGLDSSTVTALAARSLAEPVRSFSVDFTHTSFEPDAVRADPDAPFARDLATHVGAEHTEIVLEAAELADEGVRAAVLRATDAPPAFWGDMWPSLYLLFRAIRQRATVALSGEAADELFGGYRWFRNPGALNAATFPWLTSGSARYFGGLRLLDQGLVQKLDLTGRRAARYREGLAEVPVLAGEGEADRRMREVTYLNLTRFVQTLLDRKDRMSMAVGLEVRVPFCDHRLVEYVFNAPWSMKSFDGREKSLLRAAARDLLPKSVVDRVKTPYPATQDPGYEQALRRELAGVLADSDAPVLPLLDGERARKMVAGSVGAVSRPYDRGSLEMALWLNRWLTSHQITLDL